MDLTQLLQYCLFDDFPHPLLHSLFHLGLFLLLFFYIFLTWDNDWPNNFRFFLQLIDIYLFPFFLYYILHPQINLTLCTFHVFILNLLNFTTLVIIFSLTPISDHGQMRKLSFILLAGHTFLCNNSDQIRRFWIDLVKEFTFRFLKIRTGIIWATVVLVLNILCVSLFAVVLLEQYWTLDQLLTDWTDILWVFCCVFHKFQLPCLLLVQRV